MENIFSVIIPVYNSDKTIERCLLSILSNTYSNFEIIIIDDGLCDNTAEILALYQEKDKRIHVYTQNNKGVSSARNFGLSKVTGDIVSFVDSDDYISSDYFEKLNEAFIQSNADVVFFGFSRVTEDGEQLAYSTIPELTVDYYESLIGLSKADVFGYTWCKALKSNTVKNIRFDEKVSLFEDEIFTCEALKKPLSISYLNDNLYRYVCTNNGTLSRKLNEEYQMCYELAYCAWKQLLGNYTEQSLFLKDKANHFARVCQYYGLECSKQPMRFYKKLSRCTFFHDAVFESTLLRNIRNNNWILVQLEILNYRMKQRILKTLKYFRAKKG